MPQSPTTAESKEDRLYIRLSPTQKRLLTRAAEARHLSTSQFVMQASLDAAELALADQTVFYLTPEQWDAFQARLDEPARTIPAIQKLFAEMDPQRSNG